MSRRNSIAVGILGLVAASGCNTSVKSDDGGVGGAASTTAANTSASTGNFATTGGVGGGLSGDTVTINMASFDVAPGQEVYKCQNFANPFGGVGEVSAFESHMTQGSHHLLVFYKPGATDSALQDCSGLEFAATPYSTQLPDDSVVFPSGVSALVPASTGLRLQSHYLNTTQNTISAHVQVTFHLAPPGSTTQHAGVMFMIQPDIQVAPHSTQVVTRDCTVPFGMNVLKATSHMHQHGTGFLGTIGGETIFQTDQWSDPTPHLFTPAKPLQSGAPIHFECTFQNDGDTPLTFGESALTNEMCIFGVSFYPVPNDNTVTVDCN